MDHYQVYEIKNNLRKSSIELSKWKLIQSAKWSSEALHGIISFDQEEGQEYKKDHDDYSENCSVDLLSKFNIPPSPNTLFTKNFADTASNKTNNKNEEQYTSITNKGTADIPLTQEEEDLYQYASSLFDCREFDRCVSVLSKAKHPRLIFLKLYTTYLSWDKKSQENLENDLLPNTTSNSINNVSNKESTSTRETSTNSRGGNPSNNNNINLRFGTSSIRNYYASSNDDEQNQIFYKQEQCSTAMGNSGLKVNIPSILKELDTTLERILTANDDDASNKKGQTTPRVSSSSALIRKKDKIGLALLYYLQGILLKLQDSQAKALHSFLTSVKLYPYNWTCWSEILDCLSRADEASLLLHHLNREMDPNNVMLHFFKVVLFQEFCKSNTDDYNLNEEFLSDLNYLLTLFPNFAFIKSKQALINYEYMDYINAEQIFDDIVKRDPYRLEDLDTYSNILYVMQKFSKLAYLAQMTSNIDRFRPETCCIVGNYYSSKQDHAKAIMYFRRALTLNKNYTNAWTLMGHEFVELKNTHAAIQAYRRAVEINTRDYKAWYGLGQAYELIGRRLYSLYYLQKACSLKPFDKRMWQSLGNCYEKMDKNEKVYDSIKCYERALQLTNLNEYDSMQLSYKLAELNLKIDNMVVCEKYMKKCCKIGELNHSNLYSPELNSARLWLARHEMSNKHYSTAYQYASGVTDGVSKEIEEARNIARECRRILDKD
ncbi:related to Anaphase-promoting complex subunit CDC23 [Saccharomycodes ludwigii]|uniref:Related to Anaphase-promoting complex subunit CDC23 n=1 Tax=Saccharomycodes ludwigii TaxID=36035 RepID=A0A376B4U2_9ASCO|nr:hypothetical protein SCDLUD_004766 [Saccharomycodes ludwigii]KAH3899327.1 hypothetical protein SCDLUD_004766 [Saccharomycodes ludwigii]SSD59661.1 related to Anaphase-promoting complex subunit CDC23 [Saccharomycodes ludwigii]